MIPVSSLSARQQGKVHNFSSPKINLGASLPRIFAGKDGKGSIFKDTVNRKVQAVKKVITARRVSDVFRSLPKISEQALLSKEKRDSLEGQSEKKGTGLGRDDLRRRRLQLRHIGTNRKANDGRQSEPITPSYNGRLATVLSVPPKLRGDEHLRTIRALLRGHTAFQDYPDHVQDQMCQAMIYQRYEMRRVITRMDHTATAFYLILAGTVLVNMREISEHNQKPFIRTVNQLGEGEAFGEIALITDSKRTASIICKTDVEVLMIEKQDFDYIIRRPLESQQDIYVEYIRNMELFKHFPCDVFIDNSQDFFYQYFKPNVVILSNSMESDYLVVVISGKCQAVAAYNVEQKSAKREMSEMEKQLQLRFPLYSDQLKREKTDNSRKNISEIENTAALEFDIKASSGSLLDTKVKQFNQIFPEAEVPNHSTMRRRSSSLTGFFDLMESKQRESGKMQPSFWSEALSERKHSRKPAMQPIAENPKSATLSKGLRDGRFKKRRVSQGQTKKPQSGTVRTWKRIAALVGVGKNAANMAACDKPKETKRYAQLAEFNEGKVFGLETMLHKDTTSAISLVSEGAECLFISKKLFLEHSNSKVLRVVSDLVVTYPTQEFIGTYIRRQQKWEAYKAELIRQHSKVAKYGTSQP